MHSHGSRLNPNLDTYARHFAARTDGGVALSLPSPGIPNGARV